MNLKISKHDGKTQYLLTIDDSELARIRLDEFDHELFKECEDSHSISDKVLAIEALTRKIEKLHEDS